MRIVADNWEWYAVGEFSPGQRGEGYGRNMKWLVGGGGGRYGREGPLGR